MEDTRDTRVIGRLGFTYGAALLLAPAAGTMLLDRAGARSLWAACALVATAGAAGQMALRSALMPRLPAVPPG